MNEFNIGDTVQIITGPMKHSVGTVVYLYEETGKYLVRTGVGAQDYYSPDQIELFSS